MKKFRTVAAVVIMFFAAMAGYCRRKWAVRYCLR